jgi:hypothetical protein
MVDLTYEEILPRAELGTRFYVNQIDSVLFALSNQTSTSNTKLLRSIISKRVLQYFLQQELDLVNKCLDEFSSEE